MAIFGVNNETIEETVEQAEEVRESPIYDSETPINDVIKQIGGYKWEVDYYNSSTTIDDYQSLFDNLLDEAVVEYTKIKDLILYLSSPLDNTDINNVEGSAIINVNIVPKNGDVIVAKLPDKRFGVYILTSVTRKTYNTKNIYEIGFKLYGIASSKYDPLYSKLESRVFNTLYYNRNYLLEADKPLYTESDVNEREHLTKLFNGIITKIRTDYITPSSKKTYSFYHDKDLRYYFDPHVEDFLLNVTRMPEMNIVGIRNKTTYTYMDMLTEGVDVNVVSMWMDSKSPYNYGSPNPYMYHTRSLLLGKVIMPTKTENNTEVFSVTKKTDGIIPTLSTTTYVLQEGIYEILTGALPIAGADLTLLEFLFLKAINNESFKYEQIKILAEYMLKLDYGYYFYYFAPLTLYLIRYYIRSQITQYV